MPELDFLALAHRIGQKAMRIVRSGQGRDIVATNPLGQKTIKADKDLEDIVIRELKRSEIPCTLTTEEAGLVKFSENPEWRFVLDPLDGSENYARGIPVYTLGLCYAQEGGTVSDVVESYIIDLVRGDEFYTHRGKGVYVNGERARPSTVKSMRDAIISLDFNKEILYRQIGAKAQLALMGCRDHRRFGPDLFDMSYTACGSIDGFVHACGTLSAVHASGVALLRENCIVTDRCGKPIDVALDVNAQMSVVAAGTKELHAELLTALNTDDLHGF